MMGDDPEMNELLRLVDQAGPLPGTLEDDLLAELHASLTEGPLLAIEDAEIVGEAEIVDLVAERTRRRGVRRGSWLVVAVAATLLVVGLAVAALQNRETTTAVEPTPTPVLVLTDIEAACARFVASTPARAELQQLVADTDPAAADGVRAVIAALEVLRRDAAAAGVPQSDIDGLEVARGRFTQTLLLVEAGDIGDAADSLGEANATLADPEDPRFVGCRSY